MTDWKLSLGDLDLSTNTIAYAMSMSREMALDYGAIEPTPDELAERNERNRVFHAEQREKRASALAALSELRGKEEPTPTLLALHSCDTESEWGAECDGCDFAGYEGEPPEWPCRTVLALAEHHRVDMPDSLPGKHYEREFVPSDGKRFTMPTPRWHTAFVDLDTPESSD